MLPNWNMGGFMRMRHSPSSLRQLASAVAVLALLLAAAGARGAAPPGGTGDAGTVTGTGKTVLTRPATVLRVQIDVPAQGKTVEEAVAQLKAKREALSAKLKSLGAAEGGVKFGEPHLGGAGPAGNAQQRYIAQMTRMAMGNRAGAKKPEGPAVVSVLLPVTAEWAIKASGAEEAIVAGYKLRETIQKSDLAGKPEGGDAPKAEDAAENQEVAEEIAGMAEQEGGAAAKAGEPQFTFVAKVAEQDRAAASKEAFEKARAEASQLARAAGGKIGRLRGVTAKVTSRDNDDDSTMAVYAQYMQTMGAGVESAEADPAEAAGPEPGMVSLKVNVSASFALE
jgi:uncharacterized protein YggE